VIRPELRTAIDEYLAGEMCGPTSEKKSRKRSLRDASTDYTAQASLDHMSAAVGEGDVGAFDKGGDGVAVRMGDVEGFFVSRSRRDEHPSISLHDFTRFQIQLRQEEIREQREWREEQRRRDEQREVREEARRDREREREEKRRAEDREREEKRRTQDREMAAQQVQAYQVLVGTVANTQTQLCGLLGQQNQGKSQFWDQAGQFFMNLAEQFAPEQGDGNNG